MSYRIGSFNVHNMGANASEEKIDFIVKIIKSQKFDIVALQEVFCNKRGMIDEKSCNANPISSIIRKLGLDSYGKKWKAYFDAPKQSKDAKEGYAFIWNSSVHLPSVKLSDGSYRVFYPRIYNQYKLEKSENQVDLVRNPLYGRFIPESQPKMEFRIINTHIRFSKDAGKNSDNTDDDIELDIGTVKMRQNEFNIIAKTIYPKLAEKIYGTQDVGGLGAFYTIMLGDYNLNLNRKWTKSPYIPVEFIVVGKGHDGKEVKLQTFNEGLTTIKRVTPENEQDYINMQKYNNNFDHVTYDTVRFASVSIEDGSYTGIKCSTKKIDVVRNYDKNDFVHYRKKISDHIPICFEFDNNHIIEKK